MYIWVHEPIQLTTHLPKVIDKNVYPVILMAKIDAKRIKEHYNVQIGKKKNAKKVNTPLKSNFLKFNTSLTDK